VVLGDVVKLESLVHRIGDAEVQGEVTDLAAAVLGIGFALVPALILVWLGFGLATVVAALLVAGLAGRQVRAAVQLIAREPVQTVAVGLGGLILTPVLAIVLFLSVIGAPLGLGILFGLWPLVAFLGYLVAAIALGDWILARTSDGTVRERPYLAAVVGVVVLQALALIPVAALLSALASLVGFGAVLRLAWRTLRSRAVPVPAMTGAVTAPTPT
jgi:hypothetical protein